MDSPKVRATTLIGRLAMATILSGLRRLRSTSFNLV